MNMTNFNYKNACKIIFGKNDESVLAQEIKNQGAKRVLIHYGKNSIVKSGLLGRITLALKNLGIKYFEHGGVSANPLRSHALEGISLVKKNKIDFILAVGGGSVIDSAKMICAGAVNKNIWDFYDSKKELKGALPLGVVLTIPAAGSEGSTASVVKDDKTGIKRVLSRECLRPAFAFVNPELCATLPKEQVAYGASDILAHLLERYFSPEENVVVTDKLLTGAIQSMFVIAPKVYKNPAEYDSMAEFCLLGTLAHNGMLALGRNIQAWESHPIEMSFISGHYNFAHGQGLSIIFPAWLKYMAEKKPGKVLQFAKEVMKATGKTDAETMKKGIVYLEKFFKSLNLPVSLKELNIDVSEAKEVVKTVFPTDVVLGGYGKLSLDDILNIVDLAK